MPLITIGTDSTLKLQVPSKGDTNWADDLKTEAWQKIADHDHTGTAGTGSKLAASSIDDDAIQVKHKLTTVLTLTGSAQSLTGLAMSADQAFKVNYKLTNAAGTSVQVGTVMGQAGDFITDEFMGTDLSATYSHSTNQLQITGTNTDVLEYSIEFLE